jgi:hypothetical protein
VYVSPLEEKRHSLRLDFVNLSAGADVGAATSMVGKKREDGSSVAEHVTYTVMQRISRVGRSRQGA